MSVVRVFAASMVASLSIVMACSSGDTTVSEDGGGELAYELGGTVTLKAVHSGKCVGVAGNSLENGAQFQQRSCTDSDSRRFKVRDVGGGQHELVVVSSGKCLDVSGVSYANGAIVHQWDCVGGANQRWLLSNKGNGRYELRAAHSGKCLDVKGASTQTGTVLQQLDCNDRDNQRFQLAGLDTSVGTGGSSSTGGSGNSTAGTGNTAATGSTGGDASLTWSKANLTNFESYPDPGSDECVNYNGCTWAGYFAGVEGKQTEEWVKAHDILAVHSKDFAKYKLKTLRLKQGNKQIDAVVYDMCSDSDCDGCCTRNAGGPNGFLIDVEKYTMQRFGSGSGVVDWACLDCK